MEKKSISASLLIIYLAALFAVVGSCFYAFIFKGKQIKLENVSIVSAAEISVYGDEDKAEIIDKLKLSDMEIGIRPVTGEPDKESQIPSTINDEGTSEGYYATVYVDATTNYKIVLKNIEIKSEKDELLVKEERKNLFFSIKDINGTTTDLKNDSIDIVTFSDVSQTQKFTFLFWLGAMAGEDLQGAKISFELSFETI